MYVLWAQLDYGLSTKFSCKIYSILLLQLTAALMCYTHAIGKLN